MRSIKSVAVGGLALLSPMPAYAHHASAGNIPMTFAERLVSALAHSVIGLELLLALVVVGLLAYSLSHFTGMWRPRLLRSALSRGRASGLPGSFSPPQ